MLNVFSFLFFCPEPGECNSDATGEHAAEDNDDDYDGDCSTLIEINGCF